MRVSGQCAVVLLCAAVFVGYPGTAADAQAPVAKGDATTVLTAAHKIGRASCRERVH